MKKSPWNRGKQFQKKYPYRLCQYPVFCRSAINELLAMLAAELIWKIKLRQLCGAFYCYYFKNPGIHAEIPIPFVPGRSDLLMQDLPKN